MYPRDTQYYLVTRQPDYKRCQGLLRQTEFPARQLHFPTVMALRGDKLLGFVTTTTQVPRAPVCAGPLVLDPHLSRPIFVAMRLMEGYEQILEAAGVTSYIFGIDKTHPQWFAAMQRLGMPRYRETDEAWWFQRRLTDGCQ